MAQVEYALAFPDVQHGIGGAGDPRQLRRWDGDCFMGSSAGAIVAVAREFGYVLVDVEPGLDLFLVDGRRWGARPVPTLRNEVAFRPFNIRRKHAGLADTRKARSMLDYSAWRQSNGSVAAARVAAQARFAELRRRPELPCFVDLQCAQSELVLCRELWSMLCPPKSASATASAGSSSSSSAPARGGAPGWFDNPCHGTRGLWHTGRGIGIFVARDGGNARRFRARDLNLKTAF